MASFERYKHKDINDVVYVAIAYSQKREEVQLKEGTTDRTFWIGLKAFHANYKRI